MPDPDAPRKPPRRIWLFLPYIAVGILAAVGSIGWLREKIELERRLDARAQALRALGYDVSWSAQRVEGFPFRLDLTLDKPRIADRAGWALSAPELKGEAYAYATDHWVAAASSGFTLTRPDKGPLTITGQAIRASISGLGSTEPRLSFQGAKLVFTPGPGAPPPMISGADLLEAHLQPGPDDQAALLLKLQGGRSPTGGGQALAVTWDARLSRMSQLSGSDWPSAVRHWISAGGVMSVVQAQLDLGELKLSAKAAPLTVGLADGRLQGALPVTVDQERKSTSLTFQSGLTTLGPLVLGPAPKVF